MCLRFDNNKYFVRDSGGTPYRIAVEALKDGRLRATIPSLSDDIVVDHEDEHEVRELAFRKGNAFLGSKAGL